MRTPSRALVLVLPVVAACVDDVVPELPDEVAARCRYENRFASQDECRDYLGPWDLEAAAADCEGWGGALEEGLRCDAAGAIGWCVFDKDSATPIRVSFEEGSCAENERGCELFGGGVFVAEGQCGDGTVDPEDQVLTRPFPEPVESCVEPLPGDEPGSAEGGQVCQWLTMQGCTEPGRSWADYGSCEIPLVQRPYYPVAVRQGAEDPDPRLDDASYAGELAWVKSELSSCSCVCCHSTSSPEGPANWYLEQPGNFVNGMFDSGIAQGAGVIDSTVLGDIEPEQNNGFTRLPSVFPSTDPSRMQAFFQRELAHRGLSSGDFDPIGYYGPLTDQDLFEPSACTGGEGVAQDGTVSWSGGAARMVLVLEEGSANPGVPPNRDTPAGTVWRVDASDPTARMLVSGLSFGVVPDRGVQRFPSTGAPAALAAGRSYYLYVSADYLQPITRCLFTH
ncbi:MAG: hypothetical protein IT383_25860 [Deltaproteobacteria bacterium]|nr:hypothetical protein [Deltaproteobacteria bacterium]